MEAPPAQKVAVVTGSNTGIGREVALALARASYTVVFACRSEAKTLPVIQEIVALTGNKNLHFLALDLASFASIRKFVENFNAMNLPLHALVNNAGLIWMNPKDRTTDGFEMMMGTNHLGPFLLTNLLLPKLTQSAPSRIVMVASDAHLYGGPIDLNDINSEKSGTGPGGFYGYGRSKLANLLFTFEMARRLQGTPGVTVNAMHPGPVKTDIGRDAPWYLAWIMPVVGLFFRTPAQGADTAAWLALAPEVEGKSGLYFQDRKQITADRLATDTEAAGKFWELSAKLTGLDAASQ